MQSPSVSETSNSMLSTLDEVNHESESSSSEISQGNNSIAAISQYSEKQMFSPRLISIIQRQASVHRDAAIMALREASGDVAGAIFNLTCEVMHSSILQD
eukprot:187709_1